MEEAQKEVWDVIQTMNLCWTTGDPTELKNYFHKDMVAITPTNKNRIEGGDSCVAGWTGFSQNTKNIFWKEFDPKIQIYRDTAIVTYYFDMSFDTGGQTINMGGRDMFTLIKENGQWWIVADQFSPYPQ